MLALSATQPAGPINGSLASVFLLKNRPVPGQAAYDSKHVPLTDGHNGTLGQHPSSRPDNTYGSPAIEMQQI